MRVFILGYGLIGSNAARMLAGEPSIERITLGGRNLDRVVRTAEGLGPKVDAVEIDSIQVEKLSGLLAEYDILVNAAPKGVLIPAIRAATQARASYCDMLPFTELGVNREVLDGAQSAGVTGIHGNGVACGLSNQAGVLAAQQLDEVLEIHNGLELSWLYLVLLDDEQWESHFGIHREADSERVPEAFHGEISDRVSIIRDSTLIEFWTKQAWLKEGKSVLSYRNGTWTEVDPVEHGVDIPLLSGGDTIAHPACGQIPTGALPQQASVPTAQFRFSGFTRSFDRQRRAHAEKCSTAETSNEIPTGLINRLMDHPDEVLPHPNDYTERLPFWVSAFGTKNEWPARYTVWLTKEVLTRGNLITLNAAPLVASALAILNGEIDFSGIRPVEDVFEFTEMLARIHRYLPDRLPQEHVFGRRLDFLD